MALRLIIEDDEGSTTIVPLGQEVVTIGRQQGNTIQLTEKNVSRRHAKLTPEGESWVLEDLGSYNGVKVNGRVASGRAVLQEGDVVQIGDYHLALTEDVDRRSLNYDRARAANDVEPMLVSSSTNLPRLSPAEIAALSSGQHPAQAGAAAAAAIPLDSGQMPIARPGVAAGGEAPQRRSGAMLGLGLVAIGAVALLGFWMISRPDGGASNSGTTVADGSKDGGKAVVPTKADPTSDTSKSDTKAGPEVASPQPVVDPTAGPTKDPTPEPPPESTTDAKVDPSPEPTVDPDTGETPVEVPDEDPVSKPNPTSKPPRPERPSPTPTPKKPPPTTATPSKPTPPAPTPEVDVEALLLEAGKAIFKNNAAQGYELASKAYKSKASSRAAFLMTNAACRMGDKGKATKALAKISKSSEYYQQALEICRSKSIPLD